MKPAGAPAPECGVPLGIAMPPNPQCCVACGRPAGPGRSVCSYCGEAVYEAPLHRIARRVALVLLAAGTPLFAWLRACRGDVLRPAPSGDLDSVLLALAAGMLLIPDRQTGIPETLAGSRRRHVLRALAGTWLLAAATWLYLLALGCGSCWNPVGVVLAVTLPAAGAVLSIRAGISWRGAAAGALLAAGWSGNLFCLA